MVTKADRERFVELLTALASSFGREADEPMLLGYRLGLGDLPIQSIERGVARAIRELKFMPSPAELRELSGGLTAANRAAMAWVAFERIASRDGGYSTVDFDDRLINATVYNLGGWVKCCERLEERKGDQFLRKDFERVYTGLLTNPPPASWLSPLLGLYAQQNSLSGAAVPKGLEVNCGLRPTLIATEIPALPHIEQARQSIEHRPAQPKRLTSGPASIGEVLGGIDHETSEATA